MNLRLCRITMLVLGTLNTSVLLAQAVAVPPVDETTLEAVTVHASADESAAGLTREYAGGQVARGGRVGMFGSQDMMDTPFSSTNYTQQYIQDRQAQSVADVLQADPSVRIGRGFGNYQETYIVRGFPIISDDIAYNGLFGILPRQYISTEMIERVELFHGANAFLNGASPGGSGSGGTINLLPKRAGNEPLTQFSVGTQTGSQTYSAADLSRRFGEENRFGARVNVARREGGTGVDNEKRALTLFSLGLDYRGNDFRLSADIGSQDSNLRGARSNVAIGTATSVPTPPGASANYAQPWDYSSERDVFGTVRGELDLSPNTIAWAAFGARKTSEYNMLNGTITLNATGNGNGAQPRFDNGREDTVHTAELGIRSTLHTGPVKHTLVASANTYELNSRNAFRSYTAVATNIYNPPVILPGSLVPGAVNNDLNAPKTTNKISLNSLALADSMGFFDERLLLTLGARQQNIKQSGYAYNTALQTANYNQNALTPSVGLLYKLTLQISVYGNYIENLQQGGTAGAGTANFGQIFAPYKSKQKEVGVKYDAGKLGMSAALYTTAQPSAVTVNNVVSIDGEQRNRGLELSAFGEPLRGVRLLGGVTFTDARLTKTANGINNEKRAVGVPATQGNAGVEWDVPGTGGLSLSARAVYTSPQQVNLGNTLSLPSWTRFDAGARYLATIGGKLVTLRARVDNIANKAYWSDVGNSNFALIQGGPRIFVTTASVDF